MGRLWALVVVVVVCCAAVPAGATTPPKVALIYGDSLVWESQSVILSATHSRHVNATYLGGPGQAPCDWLATLDADLAAFKPAVVALSTAGNSMFACMTDANGVPWVMGSDGFYARYRADLDSFFAKVTASGARMVFVADPPMADPVRNAAVSGVIAIAAQLAGQYHGVSIATKVRTALSVKGLYVAQMKCARNETAAMGCANGLIAVRTITGAADQIGLHLCPEALSFPAPCVSYSSGEKRFGTALATATTNPPAPVLL